MKLAIGKVQRRDDVIGHALVAQVVEHRKIHRAIGIGDMAPQCGSGLADMDHRAVAKGIALRQIEAAVGDDRSGIGPPDKAAAEDFRMQRAHERHGAPKRQADGDETLAQFGEHLVRQRRRPRAVDEPVDDGLRGNGLRHHVDTDLACPLGSSGELSAKPSG